MGKYLTAFTRMYRTACFAAEHFLNDLRRGKNSGHLSDVVPLFRVHTVCIFISLPKPKLLSLVRIDSRANPRFTILYQIYA